MTNTFQCPYPRCNKCFQLKGNLKRHLNIHFRTQKFPCRYCGKEFLRKADTDAHERVHTGEKPYACRHENCSKRFARQSDLKSHERTHGGTKAFACTHPNCGKRFTRRFDLGKHQKLQHGRCEDPTKSPRYDFTKAEKDRKEARGSETDHSISNLCIDEILICPSPTLQSQRPSQSLRKASMTSDDNSACKPSNNTCVDPISHDYWAHAQNPGCCHLAIAHGNHFDYVVNNHLLCQTSVKNISGSQPSQTFKLASRGRDNELYFDTKIESKQQGPWRCNTSCNTEPSHGPGCGHLPVRHKDHIDYVVENNLFCQEYGGFFPDDLETNSLELIDDEFWDFYNAVGSFSTSETNLGIDIRLLS
uniref:Uncharacterized protein AlNc14C199G8639 n=1 Tax=Albugo laibachii Nc14 TaxID=890382 RepID=F0WQG8_9STRA|nr:conserved hypothetical protein [Albugo laibachii Nc14]|eukprot:CCA23577.1 conserved hypothetical protein [Albugo laibachii Nc14]